MRPRHRTSGPVRYLVTGRTLQFSGMSNTTSIRRDSLLYIFFIQDLEATLWLEQFLIDQDRTLVLTSHDQVFLNNVVEETIILRDKTLRYFEGTPRAFDIDCRKRRKAGLKQQAALDKKKEHVSFTAAFLTKYVPTGNTHYDRLSRPSARGWRLARRPAMITSASLLSSRYVQKSVLCVGCAWPRVDKRSEQVATVALPVDTYIFPLD